MPTSANIEIDRAAAGAVSVEDPAWRHGLQLLNAGSYWESHEALEMVWRKAPPNSRERYLVQGLIQLANGLLKAEMGHERARRRLAKLSREAFERAFPYGAGALLGIDAAQVFRAAEELAGECAAIRFDLTAL